jgi:hypothetical protein
MMSDNRSEFELIRRLEMIIHDTENDAKSFDGRPFDGKTVAEYFGYHGAAIAALAETIIEMLKNR